MWLDVIPLQLGKQLQAKHLQIKNTMTIKQSVMAAVLVSLCSSIPPTTTTLAHHGVSGQFDLEQILTVSGEVNRVRFVNPHSYVYFKVANAQGEEEQWRCELRSGSLLKRKGWTTDMFEIGSTIKVFGSPDRRDPKTVYAETVTFADGSVVARYDVLNASGEVIVGERDLKREDGTPNFAGVWSTVQEDRPPPRGARPRADGPPEGINLSEDGTPLRVGAPPPMGRPPQGGGPRAGGPGTGGPRVEGGPRGGGQRPAGGQRGGRGNRPPPHVMTQIGIDEQHAYTEDQNPKFNCEPTNIIYDYDFDQLWNKFEQTGSAIVITYGFMGMVRTIHLVGGFPDEIEPSVTGYSVGKWEGDTLVVHTIGFKPGFLIAIGGSQTRSVRHGDQMEITERFTMSEDGSTLTREYTVVDPVYLAEPHSHVNTSVYTTDPFIPTECDELKDDLQQ